MKKVVILSIMLLTLLSGRVKPVEAGTYKVNPMTVDLMNSHNLYVLLDDLRLFNGELVNEEVCQLEEDNIFVIEKKAKQKKQEEIKDWREKMKKAGIKPKPRKYYKSPRDLSIHTHSKCKVPALAKRKGE